MKKYLFLSAMLLAAIHLAAADVDLSTAQTTATQFISHLASSTGRHAAPGASGDVRLVHTELNSSNAGQAVYYIFNSDDSYIIIAGDDRAEEVLAYGDSPIDMNNLPDGMKFWLECYMHQIEYLQAHPGMVVKQAPRRSPARQSESVQPLLTAMWNQTAPYYNQCPIYNGKYCLTGCPATSLTMVFHYWKYPTEITRSIPGYTTRSLHLSINSLPPTTFDWDNMRDSYRSYYSSAEANAVAWLMRYVGQAERMDYTPDASGSYGENILQTVRMFGYDEDASLVFKTDWDDEDNYSDEEWALLIQDELTASRPIVFCAYSPGMGGYSGHAFNVDGYDAVNNKYHINWGWGGSSNGYCSLNAFHAGGSTYNIVQQMIIGIEPPATTPTIKVKTPRVNMSTFAESTETDFFLVKGKLLTHDVTLTLNDENGVFSLNTNQISLNELVNGRKVTVKYSPPTSGFHTATVTLSSEGAPDVTVTLNGTAVLETYDPVLTQADSQDNKSFEIQWRDATQTRYVSNYRLEVAPVPFHETRLKQSFDSEYDGNSNTDWSSKLDEITDVKNWSGSKIYRGNGYIILGSATKKGWIETPSINMRGNNGMMTVKVTAKCTGSETAVPLKITYGENDTTVIISNEMTEYCLLLPHPVNESAKVMLTNSVSGKRVQLRNIEVIAGDDYSEIDLNNAKYVEGITELNYCLSGITPGFYGLRVQAVYTDGTISQWSNRMFVQLEWTRGDVNRDGEVNIADVNTVIDVILNQADEITIDIADMNGDGEINLADINAIIDKILKH